MNNLLTQETPGKVLGLLGAALFSLAFMFSVSATDASFSGAKVSITDPLDPAKVMAVVDSVANSYSGFLYANLITPVSQDLAMAADNISWVASGASEEFVKVAGINTSGYQRAVATAKQQGKVAGASTVRYAADVGFSIDTLYSLLVR